MIDAFQQLCPRSFYAWLVSIATALPPFSTPVNAARLRFLFPYALIWTRTTTYGCFTKIFYMLYALWCGKYG